MIIKCNECGYELGFEDILNGPSTAFKKTKCNKPFIYVNENKWICPNCNAEYVPFEGVPNETCWDFVLTNKYE